MNILSVASEAVPYIKTGGLADVAGALPGAMVRLGHPVITVLPLYGAIDRKRFGLAPAGQHFPIAVGGHDKTATVWHAEQDGQATYFIECPEYFDREGLYGDDQGEFGDNPARFSFFCRAALKLCQVIGFVPDVIHCHDWQTALLPAYLKHSGIYPELADTATLLTIHNLAYQGIFGHHHWHTLGLPGHAFAIDGLEFHGNINLLKGGMVYADKITTVSGRYAIEIQQPEYGCGLDGMARHRQDDLTGIVNGIDTTLWDPARDRSLTASFSATHIAARTANRSALCEHAGFLDNDQPILGMVGRLAEQKGVSLILEALGGILATGSRLVILGEGDPELVAALGAAARAHPGQIACQVHFDEAAARRIYAGVDLYLMPSRFEPCGLAQLIAMRYGAPPIVHRVGGLMETVIPYAPGVENATGFGFDTFSADALIECIEQAVATYHQADMFAAIRANGMARDSGWQVSACGYEAVYLAALDNGAAVSQ